MNIAESINFGQESREPPLASCYLVGFSPKAMGGLYLDIALTLHMSWEATRDYEYSKLYYNTDPGRDFDESRVICFRVPRQGIEQKIRLLLPEEVKASQTLSLRIDPFPYCQPGHFHVGDVRILYAPDDDVEASRKADLMALKQWTREQVVKCEQLGQREVKHFPESLCLEVTPRCNLTCGHCSTHGTPEAHERHNNQPEIPLDFLDHLGKEVFPSLTSITAIGRGEPLYLSDETWDRLVAHIRANHMLFSIVSNGVLLRKRLTPDLIPLIDTITVSIDGLQADTFAENRGGASIEKVLANVRYYHELRKQFCLPRRPRLCLSWTMKRNNIHEMLEFLEVVKEFEPDIMFTRHLMIFHEKDRHQSLVNDPDYCNFYLEKVYQRMKELGIRTECPPVAENDYPSLGMAHAPQAQVGASHSLIAMESDGSTRLYVPNSASRHLAPPVIPRTVYNTNAVMPAPVFLDFTADQEVPCPKPGTGQDTKSIPPVVPLDLRKRPPATRASPADPVPVDPCMFVYRTANIHTDGKIHVCPRPNAPLVGNFHEHSFPEIWTGDRYQKVRNSLDTENEFHECRYCWYRESKYHPQRFQRDENGRQNYSLFDPVRYLEKTWDFMLNRIEKLTAINRSQANPHVEREIRRLRIQADIAPQPTTAIVPPDLLTREASAPAATEIPAHLLTADTLRAAIQEHRYLIVRNLFTKNQSASMIRNIDMGNQYKRLTPHTAYTAQQEVAWFSPANLLSFDRSKPKRKDLKYRFESPSDSLLAADAPHALFELLELYEQLNFRYMLSRYFGEAPVLTVRKSLLHCLSSSNEPAGWHVEKSARNLPIHGIKLWVALTDCGGETANPALELIKTAPTFNAGDGIFFDPLIQHRTARSPSPAGKTYATESSFFAVSACPEVQIRMIF